MRIVRANRQNRQAYINQYLECIEELFKYNASVDLARYGGWTPLHEATRFGYIECMKKLIEYVCKSIS